MNRSNQEILAKNFVRNHACEIAITDMEQLKALAEHYVKLINVEFN